MPKPEELEALGVDPPVRRPSAVSQILQALRVEVDLGQAALGPGKQNSDGYRLNIASDDATRARASALARRVYQTCGYVAADESGLDGSRMDAAAQTLTLLAEDANGREAGTVSLVFDSPAGLPCDELYGAELAPLRAQGRRLVEVTRLAIAPEFTHSKALLVQLFNFISVYVRRLEQGTDFMIEVHPRHVAFYRRMLLFEVLGPARACPRVNGAPAVLLRLELSAQTQELGHVGGTQGRARGPHGKTLYAHFYALADEHLLAAFLTAQQRPENAGEARRFQPVPQAFHASLACAVAGD